jgi:hypothetical protein
MSRLQILHLPRSSLTWVLLVTCLNASSWMDWLTFLQFSCLFWQREFWHDSLNRWLIRHQDQLMSYYCVILIYHEIIKCHIMTFLSSLFSCLLGLLFSQKLIFGMQLYFDPTRKTTQKKWKSTSKNGKKWKTTSKKWEWKTTSFLFEN